MLFLEEGEEGEVGEEDEIVPVVSSLAIVFRDAGERPNHDHACLTIGAEKHAFEASRRAPRRARGRPGASGEKRAKARTAAMGSVECG